MKTVLLAIFAVACLAGQAALAQAPLSRLGKAHRATAYDHDRVVAHLRPPR
jgi:Ni/Co efflux regulator RcnB